MHAVVPKVEPGGWLQVRNAGPNAVLTTGAALQFGLDWLSKPEFENHSLFSMPLWSMQAKPKQIDRISMVNSVMTIEDHLLDGGFGSWLMESVMLDPSQLVKIRVKALDASVCGKVGTQGLLNRLGGIAPV